MASGQLPSANEGLALENSGAGCRKVFLKKKYRPAHRDWHRRILQWNRWQEVANGKDGSHPRKSASRHGFTRPLAGHRLEQGTKTAELEAEERTLKGPMPGANEEST
jgi:hypothetical protein